MFHPIGPQPRAVYWRRRLTLLGVLLALVLVGVRTTLGGGTAPSAAAERSSLRPADASVAATSLSHQAPPTRGHRSTAKAAGRTAKAAGRTAKARQAASSVGSATSATASSSSAQTSAPTSASSAAPGPASSSNAPASAPRACTPSQLAVAAQTSQTSYAVGDQPVVSAVVTNVSDAPCVQDLADREVTLSVYNGESRVWGSHDCKVEPGVSRHTLAPSSPVVVSVTWSGLSSEPGCKAVRQRVGAGSYTLYAEVSGKRGTAASFVIR